MLATMPIQRRAAPAGRWILAELAVALLAAALALTGCSSGHPGATVPAPHGAARVISGVAALRAGLTTPGNGPAYYLALGDSLSQGLQPGPSGGDVLTPQGYPDQLASRLRPMVPHLRLVKLGCPGETTTTMIHGGICRYRAGSQLGQAIRFLRAHRGHVALVTIDIGANDPNSCVIGAQPLTIPACLYHRLPELKRNLATILSGLRGAAGQHVLMVGMTYYVPELGLWRSGQSGRQIAVITAGLAAGVNKLLAQNYHRIGARVANVFQAFRSTDFGTALTSGLTSKVTPPNVTAICELTWMCARPPRGPNEHANVAGYRVIAQAFWHAIKT
jgi:lysophospholipase L1-like esterase